MTVGTQRNQLQLGLPVVPRCCKGRLAVKFATRQGWKKVKKTLAVPSVCQQVIMQIKITPLPQLNKKFLSLSIYPYNITIQASGHLLSLSKQKSSLKTLVMQVMAWNHPFSRKMVILHLESKEDWLGVQSYYVSQIQSPLVIWEQLTNQSMRGFFFSSGINPTEAVPGFFFRSCWHISSMYCCLPSLWKA